MKNKNIESRYSVKTINPDNYKTIEIVSNTNPEPKMTSQTKPNDIPQKIDTILFMDIEVPVYYDMNSDDNYFALGWKHKGGDNFYQGVIFMNHETGEITYPDGVEPPVYNHEDWEVVPNVVIVGRKELDSNIRTIIMNCLSEQYIIRNKNWLKNEK